MREVNATGRGDPTSWYLSNQGRSQPSDSNRRGTDNYNQAGHSRDATARTTSFEPLKMFLETFLTRLCRTSECSEKSRTVFKKPRCYKDGCIDTWIEVIKLQFEEEDLTERQESSALTSTLEGTALNLVMAKKQYQRDKAEKIFEILLNRFGPGLQRHRAMTRFEKRGQREDKP